METRRVQLCTLQKLRYLQIAHWCRAISRLRTGATQSRDCVNPVRNLEIGSQFRDSENAQRNFEFSQIPRLRGTEIKAVVDRQMELDNETSAMQLHAMLTNKHDINVSLRTLLRCRTSLGWTFRGSAYCQLIREANKVKHLEWCQRHPYSDEAFKDVIFTGKCTVQLELHCRFACRRIDQQPKPKQK